MTDHHIIDQPNWEPEGPTIAARFRIYPEPEPKLPVTGIVLIGAAVVWTAILWVML